MSGLEELIDRYCQGWTDPSPLERRMLIQSTLDQHAVYCDARTGPVGMDALIQHINRLQQQRPGARVLRTSAVDLHHSVGRFSFHVLMADETVLLEGVDFFELSGDGTRLQRVVGFFGPLRTRDG